MMYDDKSKENIQKPNTEYVPNYIILLNQI